MNKHLKQHIVRLFFAIKCLGLTSYTPNIRADFSKTNFSTFLKSTIIILILILLVSVDNCVYHYEDVAYAFEIISHYVAYLYIFVLIIVFNSKQTSLLNIYYTISNFEKLIENVSKKRLNITKIKRNIIRIRMLRNFWILFYLFIYIGLKVCVGTVSVACGFQYLLLITMTNVTELLLIYFFVITVHILKHFNAHLRQNPSKVPLKILRKIYGAYFDVKARLQNINGILIFFKFTNCSLNVTGMIYAIIVMSEMSYYGHIYIIIVVFFAVFNNVLEILSTLYFVNIFYSEVTK